MYINRTPEKSGHKEKKGRHKEGRWIVITSSPPMTAPSNLPIPEFHFWDPIHG